MTNMPNERALTALIEESEDLHSDAMRTTNAGLADLVEQGHERRASGGIDPDEIAEWQQTDRSRLLTKSLAGAGLVGVGLTKLLASPAFAQSSMDVQAAQTAASIENLAIAVYKQAAGLAVHAEHPRPRRCDGRRVRDQDGRAAHRSHEGVQRGRRRNSAARRRTSPIRSCSTAWSRPRCRRSRHRSTSQGRSREVVHTIARARSSVTGVQGLRRSAWGRLLSRRQRPVVTGCGSDRRARTTSCGRRRQADDARSRRSVRRGRAAEPRQPMADTEMFQTTEYSFDTISQRLRESAYEQGCLDHAHRRARRPRTLVLLRGRPAVLRAAPQSQQGSPSQPADLRRTARRRHDGRVALHPRTRTPRAFWPSPTTSIRPTVAPTSPAFEAALTRKLAQRLGPPRRRASGCRRQCVRRRRVRED